MSLGLEVLGLGVSEVASDSDDPWSTSPSASYSDSESCLMLTSLSSLVGSVFLVARFGYTFGLGLAFGDEYDVPWLAAGYLSLLLCFSCPFRPVLGDRTGDVARLDSREGGM